MLFVTGSVCGGLGSPSSAPLPTAIIPLPLDPNFPPVVLPSYPTNTNTPNTQSTSGYSTAGHSRSSSPMSLMGPTNHGPGLLQLFDNGLLPLPTQPPCSSSSGGVVNPNFVLAAASTDLGSYPQFFPNAIGQFVVYFHINPSVSVSFTVGDQSQVVKGQYSHFVFFSLKLYLQLYRLALLYHHTLLIGFCQKLLLPH